MADEDRVDTYIKRAQGFIASGKLDSDEMDYKLKIVSNLRIARGAALAEDEEWAALTKKALTRDKNNLDDWRPRSVITRWIDREPNSALRALQALWAKGDTPTGERIRAFVGAVPEERQFKGTGTRMRSVSVLLMALGPDSPPFKVTEFNKAYDRTGYPRLKRRTPEEEQYEHALAFLDLLVERTSTLGFARPRNRLEAHSVVWMNERAANSAEREMAALIAVQEKGGVDPKIFFPENLPDGRERVAGSIVRRRGQPKFRRQLIDAYNGRCAVTGYDVEEVLEACHITPYRGQDTNHPGNGILLRADLHSLFDLGLIAFDSATTQVLVAESLHGTSYGSLVGAARAEPSESSLRPSPEALDAHRKWAGL